MPAHPLVLTHHFTLILPKFEGCGAKFGGGARCMGMCAYTLHCTDVLPAHMYFEDVADTKL